MESPSRALITLSSPSPRRRPSISDPLNSPEFEFWNISRNNPEPANVPLHSADELFSHGFLLPLHYLPIFRSEPECDHEPGSCADRGTESGSSEPSALITSDATTNGSSILGASKRWREIFKRTENKITRGCSTSDEIKREKVDKGRKKDKKTGHIPGSAELNINIWPFSRSRSSGNNSKRSSRPATSDRKVSSAPCSRSNSSGDSKSSRRGWSSSLGRAGVHLGRASPVWRGKGAGTRLHSGGEAQIGNVPVRVGYKQGLSCRSEENGVGKRGGGSSNLFGLRGLFSKKSQTPVLTV